MLSKKYVIAMLKLGWKPYQNDHEDANGQFEMNWHYLIVLQLLIVMFFLNLW
jgi:glutamine synthetase